MERNFSFSLPKHNPTHRQHESPPEQSSGSMLSFFFVATTLFSFCELDFQFTEWVFRDRRLILGTSTTCNVGVLLSFFDFQETYLGSKDLRHFL